jgi:hypothetical protein
MNEKSEKLLLLHWCRYILAILSGWGPEVIERCASHISSGRRQRKAYSDSRCGRRGCENTLLRTFEAVKEKVTK